MINELMTETVKTHAGDVRITLTQCRGYGQDYLEYAAEYTTEKGGNRLHSRIRVPDYACLTGIRYRDTRQRLLRDLAYGVFQEVA